MTQRRDLLAPGWSDAIARARPWRPPPGRYLLVAPHPDDEAIMFGGHLARLAARADQVHLIAVTDGEGAYPGAVDGDALAALRRSEQTSALGALGLAGAPVQRLGVPDGDVASHEDELVTAVSATIETEEIDVVLAPWHHDHHTDHEACGRAVRRAVAGASRSVTVVSGLFWSMLREPAGTQMELCSLALSVDERARKRAAISAHRSQVTAEMVDEPVLGDIELTVTHWANEHVIVQEPTEVSP